MKREAVLRSAVAGALAGVAGLAVAELIAGWLHTRLSPVVAVGESIIELTPGQVAERAINAVGQADKPLLVTGVVTGVLVVSAAAGVIGTRRWGLGAAILVAMTAIGALAVLTRADAEDVDVLPVMLAGLASLAVYGWLVPRAVAASAVDADAMTRRQFLQATGIVLASAAVVGALGRWAAQARSTVEAARNALRLNLRQPPTPQGVNLGIDGVTPWVTPNDEFYRIDTTLSPPLVEPKDWELRIHGMVDHEVTLTYRDLIDRGLAGAWITLCCVSNEVGGDLISNAWWSGVRIDDLLADVGVSPHADAVLSTSHDGWTCGTPLAALTDGRHAMLAVAMNGQPLPIEHGFPVRMVVPGLYGFVSATKWVVDWEVTRFDQFTAYWTERGWSQEAPVKTQSRIDTPRGGANLNAGTVTIGGVAWAQHRGIAAVHVRVDEGEWMPARLAADPSIDTWVQWVVEWQAEPGDYQLMVRATDDTGETQTGQVQGVVPDGATGWHTIDVSVE
ncbi:MAG TPA: molybdopterin-dependent oxidoreductase [Nocardioidaceae bacterium]|nr:molybdopterin-dependent oxidoreductase [Nocardioidaceae bacterium]